MLNAYISKEDIDKLLKESVSINGLINKKDFQIAISLLREYKTLFPTLLRWGIGLIKLGK